MPEFSVVIPVYNKAEFLPQTIQSVLDQKFKDFEVIAVNDGSTDQSLEILRAFNDARIKIIDQKNHGLSQARNIGIAVASGNRIALLDADDFWNTEHLETLKQLGQLFPKAGVLGTGYVEEYANGKLVAPQLNLENTATPQLIPDFFIANLKQPLVGQSSIAFEKSVITGCGGFNPNITYAEDVDFYIRVFLKYKLAYDPKVTCHHTMQAENQITRSKKSKYNVPDFQKYLNKHPNNASLRQYINLKRYFLAIFYKVENRLDLFRSMRKKIDENLLTPKQRQLLNAPRFIVMILRFIKSFLLKKGKRFTSF